MTTCPCGIAVVDCEYHAPEKKPHTPEIPLPVKWDVQFTPSPRRLVVIHGDGEVSVTILP